MPNEFIDLGCQSEKKTNEQGTETFDDGSTYEGNWEHDMASGERVASGHGIRTYADGSVYSGNFANGNHNG